jgi:stage II sporulation protein D
VKKILLLAYTALALVYLLPLAFSPPPVPEGEAASAPAEALSLAAPRAAETAAPLPTAAEALPVPRTVRVLHDGEVTEMALQEYLVGVVAGEMPASFPLEALKAQAVAARSYTLYCAASHKHPEADVCTDPGCCQAWQGEERLRESWGGDYEENLTRIRGAVEATEGEALSYQGEPVFAAFHSSSAGATEDCGAVWSPRPYLISVESPETAGDVPGYVSTLRCAPLDFRDVLLSAYPEADFSGGAENWLGELRRDASGRVESVVLGGVEIPGTALRGLFSLRSTAFTLAYTEDGFLFTVTGYGHWVGMSQYGAMVLARDGADYAEILGHYYPGTVLTKDGPGEA